jgi:beta-aspartyl-dipeptidase (metallo-type)
MGFAKSSAMAETFKNMLDMNLPIEKVLPLMTSNVSKLLKFHRKGKIEVGFDADLLVLDEQHQIQSVMANGIWHIKNKQQLVSGLFEI